MITYLQSCDAYIYICHLSLNSFTVKEFSQSTETSVVAAKLMDSFF